MALRMLASRPKTRNGIEWNKDSNWRRVLALELPSFQKRPLRNNNVGLSPEPALNYLMASAVTAAISIVALATETSAGALGFGACFVDGEIASVEVRAVHRLNRFLRLLGRAHRDECKAA